MSNKKNPKRLLRGGGWGRNVEDKEACVCYKALNEA
jgi:hypothetical protein